MDTPLSVIDTMITDFGLDLEITGRQRERQPVGDDRVIISVILNPGLAGRC